MSAMRQLKLFNETLAHLLVTLILPFSFAAVVVFDSSPALAATSAESISTSVPASSSRDSSRKNPSETAMAELTLSQKNFLYCFYVEKHWGRVSFYLDLPATTTRIPELEPYLTAEEKAEVRNPSSSLGYVYLSKLPQRSDLISTLLRLLSHERADFSVACMWPEAAVSTSTLLIPPFSPAAMIKALGISIDSFDDAFSSDLQGGNSFESER